MTAAQLADRLNKEAQFWLPWVGEESITVGVAGAKRHYELLTEAAAELRALGGGWIPTHEWLSTQLCEARNHWCEHHEDSWLDTDENHPDDWIANFLIHALVTANPHSDPWQPIETAPKDGTLILGWFDNPRWPSAPGILQWTDHNGGGWTHYANGTPTHWQKIVAPSPAATVEG